MERKERIKRTPGVWQFVRETGYDWCEGCKGHEEPIYEIVKPCGRSDLWRYLCPECAEGAPWHAQGLPGGEVAR